MVSQRIWILAVLTLFAATALLTFRRAEGDDLSSSYVGCKVLAAGQADHLYSHDLRDFSLVDDPVWNDIRENSEFSEEATLHPYVQTPLWGAVLKPLCKRLNFRHFHLLFLTLEATCMAAMIWIIAAYWVLGMLKPLWIAIVCCLCLAAEPVRYALELAQTHIFFVLLTLAALLLARRAPVWAGLLLAMAAAVKVTPAYFALYWLVSRQKRAALSFLICSTALLALTVALAGRELFAAYLHTLSAASDVLLVSFNNQSLAAWWFGRFYPLSELDLWTIHPLSATMKAASTVLALCCAVVGGILDRNSDRRPLLGAIFALTGITLFTPIAWSHYSIVLIVPAMMIAGELRKRRSYGLSLMLLAVIALNVIPYDKMRFRLHIIRPEFYAGVLCLTALVLMRVGPAELKKRLA